MAMASCGSRESDFIHSGIQGDHILRVGLLLAVLPWVPSKTWKSASLIDTSSPGTACGCDNMAELGVLSLLTGEAASAELILKRRE